MDVTKIDNLILASCHDRWQKVAMVIVKTAEKAGLNDADHGYDAIAERIDVLVRAEKLDAAGNLEDWRHSEIKLPIP